MNDSALPSDETPQDNDNHLWVMSSSSDVRNLKKQKDKTSKLIQIAGCFILTLLPDLPGGPIIPCGPLGPWQKEVDAHYKCLSEMLRHCFELRRFNHLKGTLWNTWKLKVSTLECYWGLLEDIFNFLLTVRAIVKQSDLTFILLPWHVRLHF